MGPRAAPLASFIRSAFARALCRTQHISGCGKRFYKPEPYPNQNPDPSFVPMPMHPLVGHWDARQRLSRAFRADRLSQVLVFTGPAGVGKQRLGLWLAQLVLCAEPGEDPCGRCRACKAVEALAHPDLHWFIPIPRPKTSDREKQVEEAAEALAAILEERRATSLYPPPEPMAIHGLASVRLLQRRAVLTPVLSSRKVFLIAEADRLVPQEAIWNRTGGC